MDLTAVLELRDRLSANMNKAAKSVGEMVQRAEGAKKAIVALSGADAKITVKDNFKEVAAAGEKRLGELKSRISSLTDSLSLEFDMSDMAQTALDIDEAIADISKEWETGQTKLAGYQAKLQQLTAEHEKLSNSKYNYPGSDTEAAAASVAKQIENVKAKILDVQQAKERLERITQIKLQFEDLQQAQAEAETLETALRQINSTNVAVRAFVDFKTDALKQIYAIDEKAKALAGKVFQPVISLKDNITTKIAPITSKLKEIGGKVFSAAVNLKDKLTAPLEKARSALVKVSAFVAYPVVKLKDMATSAVSKVKSAISKIANKPWVVNLKAKIDAAREKIAQMGTKLKEVAGKAWNIAINAKDKISGVLSGIKDKIFNIKNLLAGLVIGGSGAGLLNATVGGAMTLEQQEVSMSHFIGATNTGLTNDQVQAMTDEYVAALRKNANTTPFETGEVLAAGSRAVAIANGNVDESLGLIRLAEDMAAASGGTKTISDAIEALADAKLGEMERLKEFGFKVSADEYKKVGFEGVQSQLQDFYGGAAEKLATTASGLLSTIQGSAKSALTDMGSGALEMLKPQLQELADIMTDDSFMSGIVEQGSKLVSGIVGAGIKVVSFFKENWSAIQSTVQTVWTAVQPILTVFKDTMSGLGQIIASAFNGEPIDIASVLPDASTVSSAIQSIMQLLVPFASQLISAFMAGFAGLSVALANAAPGLVTAAVQLLQTLVTGLVQNVPIIVQSAITIISALIDGLVQCGPMLIAGAVNLVVAIVQGLLQSVNLIISGAVNLVTALVNALIANIPLLLNAAVQLVTGLVQGITQNLPIIIQGAINLIKGLLTGLIQNLPAIITAGVQIVVTLAAGLVQAIPELIAAIPQLVSAIIDTIMNTDWLQLGWDIISGIGNGILNGISGLFGSGEDAASSVAEGISAGSGQITSSAQNAISNAGNSVNVDFSAKGSEAMTTFNTGLTTTPITMPEIDTSLLTTNFTTAGTTAMTDFNTSLVAQQPIINTTMTQTATDMQTAVTGADFNTTGMTVMTDFNTGLMAGQPTALETATATATGIQANFNAVDMTSSGANIMEGLVNGMISQQARAFEVATQTASGIQSAFNSKMQIHSPSRVMEVSGEFTGEGAIQGLTNTFTGAKTAAADLGQSMMDGYAQAQPSFYSNGSMTGPVYDDMVAATPEGQPTNILNESTVTNNAGGYVAGSSDRSIVIQNLIGHVTLSDEADEDRLVEKIIKALADDIEETAENMPEEVGIE